MKNLLFACFVVLISSCSQPINKSTVKDEIFRHEKAFEKMAFEAGIAQAFYFFADTNAVILRENDSLIKGNENIRNYYESKNLSNATVNWSPDFFEVFDCGTLAYTYGKYIWKTRNESGEAIEIKGVFHTVWKKQKDGSWKYVWD